MTKRNALSMAILLGLAAAMPVAAQNTSAGLTGRVVDASGAPVASATVEIVHTPTGARKTVTTDANGRYSAVGLRVGGPYTVTASKNDQKDAETDVYLALAELTSVDAQLGGSDPTELESITVTADAVSYVFSPDKMGTGSNVTRDQLESFPTIDRSIQDYVRFDPRVVQTDKSRNEMSVAGQNPRYNAIRVDGVSTNDAFGLESNNLPTPKQPFSMDTIEEVAIDIANYDVTISGGAGGVINAVTKSGTNEFHGSVYGLYRDNSWVRENTDGSDFSGFTDETTYGLTVGGPIVPDKLFFFFNYEDYTLGAPAATFGPQGSSASNIVGISQADIDRVRQISQSVYGFDPGGYDPSGADTTAEEYGLKIDWNINDAHRASIRYASSEQSAAVQPGFSSTGIALSSYSYQRDYQFDTYTAQLFSDWSDSFSTEAKYSYRDYAAVRTPNGGQLPQVGIRVGNNFINFGVEENTHINILETETTNAFFAGNWFLGDHTLKFGFDYEDNSFYNLFGRRTNGSYTFQSIDLYQQGVSSRYQLFYPTAGNYDNMAAIWGLRNLAVFVQDNWVVNNNLTLTYGFRIDTPSVASEPAHNAAASNAFGFDNSATIDGNRMAAPRVGFNYTLNTERPTQVRGGVGLFQGSAASVWMSNPFSNNGLSYTDYFFSSGIGAFSPDREDQLSLFTPGTGGTQSIDFVDPDLNQPSVWKGNLAVEHELPWYGIVASAEALLIQVEQGIYYQNLNLGAPTRFGQDGRAMFWNAAGYNRANFNQAGATSGGAAGRDRRIRAYNDAIIARPTDKGGSQQGSLSLSKSFGDNSDWAWSAAYTYTNAEEVSNLTSSTSGSQWGNSNTFNPNEEVNATSAYEIRNRVSGAISWKHSFFEDLDTTFSLFGEMRSGKPFSYVFDNDANGDNRTANDLLYIPLGPGDVVFGSAAEEAGFWAFVESNDYLNSHRGQVAERNGDRGKDVNQFDVRLSQELPGFFGDNEAEVWIDIMNVGNLLNKDWGKIDEVGFPGNLGVVEYGGIDAATGRYVYRFNTPDTSRTYDDRGISRWAVQVGFRYEF